MLLSTSLPPLPWTAPLPVRPRPRPFPGALCLCRSSSPASASPQARLWASWRADQNNRSGRAIPRLHGSCAVSLLASRSFFFSPLKRASEEVHFPPFFSVVGGADVVESVLGGGEPDEEDEEGEVEEGERLEFVEVGYISSVHGLRGEVRVQPSTDFPEIRFGKPGRRWLRTPVAGKEQVREVELKGGRSHPGQKTWILSFSGVDTVDKAKQIVGATMLVKEGDRPKLDEGEFYTPDLFGMKVILKETGRQVGTVVNVANHGAGDLLQVMLNAEKGSFDGEGPSESNGGSGPVVWIPFVEAIVPEVDIDNREMRITPPKGLLELNIRSDTRSKKERRQMEWKERKKLQQRVTSAKKKLAEIGQEHVLRGFSYGVKDQRRLFAKQIGGINLKLFQHAMASINKCLERNTYAELLHAKSDLSMENGLRISHACYNTFSFKEMKEDHYALQAKGLRLVSECKVAIILMLDSKKTWESVSSLSQEVTSPVLQLTNLLSDYNRYVKVKGCGASLPLIIICPAHEMQFCQEELYDHDYFGFDNKKVWLLEEEKLPVVNIMPDDQNRHKILLRSPWEIIQSPVGPGGIFSSLSSHKIVDSLNEMRVEYVQVCSLGEGCALAHPLFLGLVSSREVNVGIKIYKDQYKDDDFDMIFAMKYLSMVTKQVDIFQFSAVPEKNKHVELVDDEWVGIEPSEPNSYRLYCPIYGLLNSCPGEISILSIVD